MNKNDLQERMTDLAVRVIKMVDAMPTTISSQAMARQIIRSGTSPSANYRYHCEIYCHDENKNEIRRK